MRLTYQKTSGRKRTELDKKVHSLCVRRGELESVDALKSEVLISSKEVEEWRKMYADLENTKS